MGATATADAYLCHSKCVFVLQPLRTCAAVVCGVVFSGRYVKVEPRLGGCPPRLTRCLG